METPVSDLLRVSGPVRLDQHDPRATPGFDGGKRKGRRAIERSAPALDDLQERLYAASKGGARHRVLLVAQGMDTSGKGGVMRHVVGLLDPQGVSITAFKAPTDEERSHDFLWRIAPHVPAPGMVGIFDRSHYEDVLIARVRELAPPAEIERRYGAINDFERALVADGVTVVKCFLHLSHDEQGERLLERLDDPRKHWKFNPGDIDERRLWPSYQRAYEIALERCSTDEAPWYLIPADRKWFRNWAITSVLLEQLRAVDPQWPVGDFDVEEQKARLARS